MRTYILLSFVIIVDNWIVQSAWNGEALYTIVHGFVFLKGTAAHFPRQEFLVWMRKGTIKSMPSIGSAGTQS